MTDRPAARTGAHRRRWVRRARYPAMIVLVSATVAGCGVGQQDRAGRTACSTAEEDATSPAGGEEPMRGVDYARAKAVLDRHYEEIQRRYRPVAGAAIADVVRERASEGDRDVFGIVVFLVDASGMPTTPQSIEGVPLTFKVSGEITIRSVPGPTC
jgi:hypothetical protein